MADGPWVRRVMRQVENLAGARARIGRLLLDLQRSAGSLPLAKADEARARRRLRALLREKEGSDG